MFEGCMERHKFDPKVPDFIWNKNRLFLEKEALKGSINRVISKPPGKNEKEIETDQGPVKQIWMICK